MRTNDVSSLSLASDNDLLWPNDSWPRMEFDRSLPLARPEDMDQFDVLSNLKAGKQIMPNKALHPTDRALDNLKFLNILNFRKLMK